MIFIVGCSLVVLVTVVAIIRSKKPFKNILNEAKYEIIYNFLGSRAMFQDIYMRSYNKTGKSECICNQNLFVCTLI